MRRLLIVGGTILGLFILYQVFVYFVAYTDDAYVRSDLVAVASEVTGPILKVHVVDNQDVKTVLHHHLQRLTPTAGRVDLGAHLAQARAVYIANRRLIVHDQNGFTLSL